MTVSLHGIRVGEGGGSRKGGGCLQLQGWWSMVTRLGNKALLNW